MELPPGHPFRPDTPDTPKGCCPVCPGQDEDAVSGLSGLSGSCPVRLSGLFAGGYPHSACVHCDQSFVHQVF